MSKYKEVEIINLDEKSKQNLHSIVQNIYEDCPGQSEHRYLTRINDEYKNLISEISIAYNGFAPIFVDNLPTFESIQEHKILNLVLGEMVGKCVAYLDYNQSYITDIRPTALSKEASSGEALLDMHNDLTFASDLCRPRTLIISPFIAEGDVPKTLIAPASAISEELSEETKSHLKKNIYEARCGSKLRWPNEQIRRLSLMETIDGAEAFRMNFSNITPIAGLDENEHQSATEAMKALGTKALEIGRNLGIALRKGQALFIPNDFCLHGRDTFESKEYDRLLLRAYVVPDWVVKHHGNTMISLNS